MTIALIGIIGITISGVFLFIADPEKFLDSGKFLSNMTIMVILLVTEVSFFVLKKNPHLILNRAISIFSWTWIFVMAVLNPPYPYHYFMIGYIFLFMFVVSGAYKWSRKIEKI